MSPNRARTRPTVWGARAISGTSTIAPRPALERGRARLQVHLGLPRARRPVEQERASAAAVERGDDPVGRGALLGQKRRGLALARIASGARRAEPAPCGAAGSSGATSASARAGVEP